MDVQMPDGTVVKNVPDGTTKAELARRVGASSARTPTPDEQKLMEAVKQSHGEGTLPTFLRGLVQGATGNFGDEIISGIKAVTQPITHSGSDAPTIGERYDQNLAQERDILATDAKNHPIADVAGSVVGTVAGPGKVLKEAKGAIGMIRQGALLGGIYGAGAGEGGIGNRAVSAAEGAGMGAASGAIVPTAATLFNKVRPSNMAARYVNRQFAASPMASESAQLSQDLGQTYTPGQATGSRSLLTIEGLVRRHPVSADTMSDFDSKQMDVSLKNLVNNLDRLHANPAGPEATGNKVSQAFDDVLTKAVNTRRATAAADFGKVDELAGGYRIVKPDNLNAAIDEIAKDFSVPGGGDASASLVRQIQGIKADLNRAGPQGLSAKETQRLLEVYGKAASGTGAVFKDMDTAQQRMIAKRLQTALLSDVDAAADAGGHVGEIATAIKTARDNYKSNSQAINQLQDSVLGRLFGADYQKAPERVAQAMKNMKPSELRQSMGILDKSDPATSQVVKRFMVEDALNTAGYNPQSGAPQPQIAGQTAFSGAKFLTAIRKSPVWNTFTPAERQGMTQAVRDLERVSFRAGTDGSPTAPLQIALGLLSNRAGRTAAGALTGGAIAGVTGGNIKEGAAAGALGGGTAGMAIPRIAKLITTPQGQQALRTLKVAKPDSPAARAATAALVALFAPTGHEDKSGGDK